MHCHGLLKRAGSGEAGFVVAQLLTVSVVHNLHDDEGHGFAHLPAASLGECQVIVVGVIVARFVRGDPVCFELAGFAESRVPQAHLVVAVATVHLVDAQRARQFRRGEFGCPGEVTEDEVLVVVDGCAGGSRGPAIPGVVHIVGVGVDGVVAHHSSIGRTQHEDAGRALPAHAPEVGIAACQHTLVGRGISLGGSGEQFGLAHGALALHGFHSVIGVVHVGLQQIHIEGIAGDADDGVCDAGAQLTHEEGVGLIFVATNHHLSRCDSGGKRNQHLSENKSFHHYAIMRFFVSKL